MNFVSLILNDPASIVLSILFSCIGSYLAIDFMSRTHQGPSATKVNWLFIIALMFGASTWAAQVLTFQSMGSLFHPGLLFAALLSVLCSSLLGFSIALRYSAKGGVEVGGAIVGFGNVVSINLVAHSSGMALSLPNSYDATAAAYAVSITLATLAFVVTMKTNYRFSRMIGAVIMVIAVGILVFGVMAPTREFVTLTDGATRSVVLPSVVVIMSSVIGTALATYNIEHQSRLEAIRTLKDLSIIDSLTGLNNRDALKTHVNALIEASDANTSKFVVLAFNLNRFRLINDVHGSEAGDQVLKTVADRLTAALEPNEFLARVSGDEFYAVKNSALRKGDGQTFAEKILEIVNEPIEWKGARISINARIGGSHYPANSVRADEIIVQADTAMCRAGALNIERPVFFDPSVDKAKRNLNALAIDLRKALDNREFDIFYQPQHSVDDRRLIGFEALIRWNHPEKGMVSPADFIPLAEKTGLINEIGAWVIRESCLEAASWPDTMKVAVNVSANQIMRDDLPDIVSDSLARSGIAPSRLELEITESGIINDERHALMILNKLKALGCSIAMDDFGTGFSSLSTFKKFPFDKLKIDRAFISDITTNKQSYAIVNAAIGISKPLGIRVLAEGVEDERQLAALRELECDEVQGFLFGRPIPALGAAALIQSFHRLPPTSFNWAGGKVVEFRKG